MQIRKPTGLYEKIIKRPLDCTLSVIGLLFLSPLMGGVALLIKAKMGSPILFTQLRPGIIDPKTGKEKIFKLYKFRTMTNEKNGNNKLLPDSARITKLGKFLRASSIDELPELFNIIKGDMALIGPRPQLVKDMIFMTDEQRQRHSVRPGLSGLAQINGRNEISWEEKFKIDLEYVKEISFWSDIKIFLLTFIKVIKHEGITGKEQITSIDYGDYLLKCNLVSLNYYNKKQEEAYKIIEQLEEKMKKGTKNKTDILIVNDNNLSLLGGERESQLILINGIKEKYRTVVIQPGEFNEKIENVKILSLTRSTRMKTLIKNPICFCTYILKISVCITKIHPKIVHSQSQVSFFIVSLLKRWKLIPKDIILFHTDRGLYSKYNKFFQWLFQYSFKFLDTLITTTEFNYNSWKDANEKKKIKLNYKVINNTAGEVYEKIDISKLPENNYLTVGFAGRMCNWKGWSLAEEICDEINKILPDIHFKMYVSCLDKRAEKDTKKMFKRMKNKYGVLFEGQINVPFSKMEHFYYNIDVYILTSWKNSESFGRTIVESMSRSTAVLTTDAGGAVEVVGNTANVHAHAKDFAQHIKIWNDNKEALFHEKENNLKRVYNYYSLKKNIEGYKNLYYQKLKF